MLFGPWGCCFIVLVLLKYLTRVMDMQIDIAVFHELEREFHLFIFKRSWYCLLQLTKRVQFLLQIPFNRLSNSLDHDYVSYAVLNYAMWFLIVHPLVTSAVFWLSIGSASICTILLED